MEGGRIHEVVVGNCAPGPKPANTWAANACDIEGNKGKRPTPNAQRPTPNAQRPMPNEENREVIWSFSLSSER
ncbi:MAG: hypothetical protein DMF27_02555, partial [Verrucomicrobia bacterium]